MNKHIFHYFLGLLRAWPYFNNETKAPGLYVIAPEKSLEIVAPHFKYRSSYNFIDRYSYVEKSYTLWNMCLRYEDTQNFVAVAIIIFSTFWKYFFYIFKYVCNQPNLEKGDRNKCHYKTTYVKSFGPGTRIHKRQNWQSSTKESSSLGNSPEILSK